MFYPIPLKSTKGLNYLSIDNNQEGKYNLVLLHGYGANAADLFGLHPLIHAANIKSIYFPEAPIEITGLPNSKAWFPIDQKALERSYLTGEPKDYSLKKPEGLKAAGLKIVEFIEELGINEHLILGGFSQGAMLSLESSYKIKPEGLLLLSSNLVDKEDTLTQAALQPGLRFLQSHGNMDPVLGIKNAKNLYNCLLEAKWKGKFIEFQGQHEIPPIVIDQINTFINMVL